MKKDTLNNLGNLLFFTKEGLRQLEDNEDALNFNIKYWLKKGDIIKLKNGYYLLKSRFEEEINKESYLEYLANQIYRPSYLSCEYVMNKYGLLTEAVYGLTSITTKKTKIINNKLGRFTYYSITPRLFSGWQIKKFESASIFIAKKSKAVFDFLYLRFLKRAAISERAVDELRINWENLTKKEWQEIEKFAAISKNKKIIVLVNLISKKYYD